MNKRLFGRVPLACLLLSLLVAAGYPVGALAAGRAWTIMVYMAADNDLDGAALMNVNQMERIGSTNDVAVVVQLDRGRANAKKEGGWTGARRYLIGRDNDLESIRSRVVTNLGAIDSGKGSSLASFGTWAVHAYPAQRYALIVWSHGTGWVTLSGYSSIETASTRDANAVAALSATVAETAPVAPPAPTVVPEIRPDIAFDDSTRSSMSIPELAAALKSITSATRRPLDLLGFDACLMQNIEVAHSLAGFATYIVGSEETMSARGWPYAAILDALAHRPSVDGEQLAAYIPAVMNKMFAGLRGPDNALTMSAIDTSKVPAIVKATSDFGYYLNYWSQNQPAWVQTVRGRVQSFSNADYVDLFHLARLVSATFKCDKTKRAAAAVMAFAPPVDQRGSTGLILDRCVNQTRVENAMGLSVYFPKLRTKAFDQYHQLEFAKATWWDEFVNMWLNNRGGTGTKQPQGARANRTKSRREPVAPISCTALLEDAAADLRHYRESGDEVAYAVAASDTTALVDQAFADDDLTGIEVFLHQLKATAPNAAAFDSCRPLLGAIETRLKFAASQDDDAFARDLLKLLPRRP